MLKTHNKAKNSQQNKRIKRKPKNLNKSNISQTKTYNRIKLTTKVETHKKTKNSQQKQKLTAKQKPKSK